MEESKKEKEFIIIKEGLLNSICSDIFTFGIMFVMFWANYNFLGDSLLIKWVIVLMLLMMAIARGSKKGIHRFSDKQKAIDFIKEK